MVFDCFLVYLLSQYNFPYQNNRTGGGSSGTTAKDALGNDVIAEQWLKTHGPGDRTLTQGLKVDFSNLYYVSPHPPPPLQRKSLPVNTFISKFFETCFLISLSCNIGLLI